MTPNFDNLTVQDAELIELIAWRAKPMFRARHIRFRSREVEADLTACHCNGTPLDLHKLLTFPDYDFEHDVFEIRERIDRTTGKLPPWFSPRCAVHVFIQSGGKKVITDPV